MRVRIATTALGITAALLAVPACSTDTTGSTHQTSSSRTGQPTGAAHEPAALTSAGLESRLLDPSDLGRGYLPKPARTAQHEHVTVIGCPALSALGGAATGGTLTFPNNAKADFTYGNSSSDVSEELYSDSVEQLSRGIDRIFDAMTGCPNYQVVAGGTPVEVTSQKLPAPHVGGDQQWSQLLTFTAQGRSSVVKQTAVRDGNLLLIVSGAPVLVDRRLGRALA
ncbi:hypothetical protein ACWDYK_14525 [Streptomyces anthocyanicus]|uniref:Putative secreted protein n=1 Tax=Streptomyces lividans 1326 TaxID=1200984 RepID=A0A7U9HAI0_STRLI|nr:MULTISPECIES: hypothetical protein [Streptomyces]EOY45656.1 putative secreted protein [Streptomyces lividans 1326]KKD13947.1 hypothetical protein TR66_18330 [Streptomyces sp. WM6391]